MTSQAGRSGIRFHIGLHCRNAGFARDPHTGKLCAGPLDWPDSGLGLGLIFGFGLASRLLINFVACFCCAFPARTRPRTQSRLKPFNIAGSLRIHGTRSQASIVRVQYWYSQAEKSSSHPPFVANNTSKGNAFQCACAQIGKRQKMFPNDINACVLVRLMNPASGFLCSEPNRLVLFTGAP